LVKNCPVRRSGLILWFEKLKNVVLVVAQNCHDQKTYLRCASCAALIEHGVERYGM